MLSRTLAEPSWPTARIVRDLGELTAFTEQPGKPVYVVGGPGLVAGLIDAGLLDELRLIVHPVALRAREGALRALAQRQTLELVSAAPMAAGRVSLAYRLPRS